MGESPAFKRVVCRLMDKGPDARLIVDLSGTEMLGSTFLGCLAPRSATFFVS
ncbi:MAG: hypothetical protein P8R42_08045 [Candidatus Binatia bacterium]|nr:hypothetical protein [Candidatus Binatia bacterium]